MDLPVSTSMRPRPVWARMNRRISSSDRLGPPTEAEMQDAIRVLEDADNQFYAPLLYLEAERILFEESS